MYVHIIYLNGLYIGYYEWNTFHSILLQNCDTLWVFSMIPTCISSLHSTNLMDTLQYMCIHHGRRLISPDVEWHTNKLTVLSFKPQQCQCYPSDNYDGGRPLWAHKTASPFTPPPHVLLCCKPCSLTGSPLFLLKIAISIFLERFDSLLLLRVLTFGAKSLTLLSLAMPRFCPNMFLGQCLRNRPLLLVAWLHF
jgi:hypothetical protein